MASFAKLAAANILSTWLPELHQLQNELIRQNWLIQKLLQNLQNNFDQWLMAI